MAETQQDPAGIDASKPSVARISAAQPESAETSACTSSAAPPAFRIAAVTRPALSALMSLTMTFAPSAPNRSAIALPMPLLLPVTIATLSLSRCMGLPYKRKKCSFQARLFLVVAGGPIGLYCARLSHPPTGTPRRAINQDEGLPIPFTSL